ncbi:MAG: flagellar hook basal-body protein [Planctomycetota bacterium]|nr:flagellar hook basal-body protein [Planctomycetota bacterium]
MIPGLYSAATAMDSTNRQQEIAAENLANLQMPGYRRRVLSHSSFDAVLRPLQQTRDGVQSSKLLGTTSGDTRFDFTQGNIQETNVKLDVALNGDGFFTVQGPNGPLYTRSGAFHVNPQGTIVNIDDLPVMGTNGPMTLPGNSSAQQVEIAVDGNIYAGDLQIGKLAITNFADKNLLQAEGASLFSAPPGAVTTGSSAEVLQGRLEMANTSSVNELINIIAISRHRDAAQRAMTTIADAIKKRIGMGQ